jgi:hypothetical protein
MAQPCRVVILAALELECRAIRRAIGDRADVEVLCIGLRAVHLSSTICGDVVILAGLAGGLDPTLKIGDLVIDGSVSDMPPVSLPWRIGSIHTADELVTSVSEKEKLFCETGALVVDMEHAVVLQRFPKGFPLIGLRVVSDTSDMAVNPAVVGLIDSRGRPRPLAALVAIAQQPNLVPHLRKLRGNAKIALHNLGLGVAALLDRFPRKAEVAYAPADQS